MSISNTDKIKVYEAGDGWRWQRRDGGNGEITGASTQGYSTQGAAIENITSTQGGEYIIVTEDEE